MPAALQLARRASASRSVTEPIESPRMTDCVTISSGEDYQSGFSL